MSKRLESPFAPSFLPPASRADDPPTSHAAERRIRLKRGTMANRVYRLLLAYPRGLTAQEVESFLRYKDLTTGKYVTGWWKRLSDLKNAGLVVGTGEVREGGEVYRALDTLALVP